MSKVLCPGEALIDFICTNKGVSLIDSIDFLKQPGGAPANVAVAIQKMGASAYFMGALGTDSFGVFLRNTLEKYHVNCSLITAIEDAATTFAFVSLTETGERDFYFLRGADAKYVVEITPLKKMEGINVVHFGSATAFLGDDLQVSYYSLLDYAIKSNKIIVFDPNYRNLLFGNKQEIFIKNSMAYVKHSHIIKVSEEEACLLSGEKNVDMAAQALLSQGAQFVVVTLGHKGAMFYTAKKHQHIPTTSVSMVDATGAGDAFIGCVLAQVANKCSKPSDLTFEALISFIRIANKAGAMTVQSYGGLESIPTWEMLQ